MFRIPIGNKHRKMLPVSNIDSEMLQMNPSSPIKFFCRCERVEVIQELTLGNEYRPDIIRLILNLALAPGARAVPLEPPVEELSWRGMTSSFRLVSLLPRMTLLEAAGR